MSNEPTGRSEGPSGNNVASTRPRRRKPDATAAPESCWPDQKLYAQPLHRAITAQALARPNAPAISTTGLHITYRDLDTWTRMIAQHLRSLGVGPETTVGLAFERPVDFLVAMISVLKAGGAYVSLDPYLPEDAWQARLEATDCRLLMTSAHVLPDLPETDVRTLCMDAAWRMIQSAAAVQLDEDVAPENLACALYFCGSRPVPQGLQISHRTLLHLATASHNLYALAPDDRVLLLSPFEEALAATEIFPVWLAGAALITTPDNLWSFSQLVDFIDQQAITVMHLPMDGWQTLLHELEHERITLPATLRQVIVSEEVITPERLEIWHRHVGQRIALCTTYGTRESVPSIDTGRALASLATPEEGDATPDVRAYILDADLRPVSPGQTGELIIAGSVPGRGYFAQARLTAEHFLPDPISRSPGSRIFRSGHRVHLYGDGTLEFQREPEARLHGVQIQADRPTADRRPEASTRAPRIDSPNASPARAAAEDTGQRREEPTADRRPERGSTAPGLSGSEIVN